MANNVREPKDYTNGTIDNIVQYFNMEYCDVFDLNEKQYKRSDFYCGITGDIDANLARHNVKGYTACVLCDSFETASNVERKLGELGFEIGDTDRLGNGGNEKSRIVYMIEQTEGFIR